MKPLAAIAMSLALVACATLEQEPLPAGLSEQPPADWPQRQTTLQNFNHWVLTGKLAVRQPGDSGSAVINRWTQNDEHYELALSSSFLGMGSTRLEGSPGFIELELPDGETYASSDPQGLIYSATGWELPIDALVWWIRGLPSPDGNYRLAFDREGQLAQVQQKGWTIRYERWRAFMDDRPELPARLTARKGEKLVRLVVSSWQPGSAD
ncbi:MULTISPECIES: lipoprotein insertase outer membrane protein LolB [Marinobacter]|uniref:Outer-membrane lipoprotein LolB n=1 Tax=Marinobacter segnicrescens TaxID=430453 RepID=A0A1I0B5X8_9GAMM|nr:MULTISPECIES: lipoprotein insertase outer membrane protein LolB [Marinobacter]UZD66918.1 lipoprotein insertase outer membrane protein LolB [Marinobacter sp. AN1]SET02170.1 outer membrane lipoprotein LolB [Marinobacter segnicrescens]